MGIDYVSVRNDLTNYILTILFLTTARGQNVGRRLPWVVVLGFMECMGVGIFLCWCGDIGGVQTVFCCTVSSSSTRRSSSSTLSAINVCNEIRATTVTITTTSATATTSTSTTATTLSLIHI